MKKNKVFFLLVASMLSLSAMVGCGSQSGGDSNGDSNPPSGDSTSSGGNQNSTSSVGGGDQASTSSQHGGGQASTSSQQGGGQGSTSSNGGSQGGGTKTDWTDNEKNLMRTNLHGLVLPFVTIPANIQYDQNRSEITVESTSNMEAGFLISYADLYNNGDWEGGDVSNEVGYSNGLVFAYRKAVTVQNNTYYVRVLFYGGAYNSQTQKFDYDPAGKFYLQASDPYMYAYPSADVSDYLSATFNSSIQPPAFNADYYDFIDIGVLGGYTTVNLEASYTTALRNTNNFTIDDSRDADNNCVARAKDGKYILRFKYDADQKLFLVSVGEWKGWNPAVINAFFAKYNKNPFNIPGINNDNLGFSFEEYPNQAAGYEYANIKVTRVTKQIVQEYVNALVQAGYEVMDKVVDDSSYQWNTNAYLLTDDGVYSLSLSFTSNATPKELNISFGLHADNTRVKSWPAAQIAGVAQATQDSVPAFTGANRGFKFEDIQGMGHVVIYVSDGSEDSAKTTYVSVLKNAKYTDNGTQNGQPRYRSEHGEINVAVSCKPSQYPGQIELLIQKINAVNWPTQDVASALADYDISIDTLPALTTPASAISIQDDGSGYDVRITCNVGANAMSEAYEDYGDVLDGAHFVYDNTNHLWVSPNGEFTVELSDNSGNEFLIIVNAKYGEWPNTYLDAVYESIGANNDKLREPYYSGSVPRDIPRARQFSFTVAFAQDLSPIYRVVCTYLSEDDASVALTQYLADLNYFYTSLGNDEAGHPHFKLTNNELDVTAYIGENAKEFYIDFVAYEEPVPFKVVGLNNDWEYEDGIDFVDATVQEQVDEHWYVSQLKAEFDVVPGNEFKVWDGTTWLGKSNLEANGSEKFSEGESDNIVATRKGHVILYLKTLNNDGDLSLAISFTPDPNDWPTDFVGTMFQTWEIDNILPGVTGDCVTGVETTTYDENSGFEIRLVGGAELYNNYEELLDVNFDYDDSEQLWFPANYRVAVNFYADDQDLVVEVGVVEEINYKLICDNDNFDIFGADAVFYIWVWGGKHSENENNGEWVELVYDDQENCFYANGIDANATGFIVARMNPAGDVPSWDAEWNWTGNIYFATYDNVVIHFTFTNSN